MTINDKIKQILKDKNLTPSYFADEIGVQRSSISHILSGRNRPSFDIIQKVIRRFPELGYDWILEEDDALTSVKENNAPPTTVTAKKMSAQPEIEEPSTVPQPGPTPPLPTNLTGKSIERILIFYTDGTFKVYSPS